MTSPFLLLTEASVSFDCDFDDDEDCLGSGMEEAPSMQSTTPRQVRDLSIMSRAIHGQ